MPPASAAALEALAGVARRTPHLDLLVLFGSRARGDEHPSSDWDLGYLAGDPFDPAACLGELVSVLGTDRVDLADLARANGLIRYRAARDGRLVYEARPGADDRFRLDAALFWCDAAPALEHGYREVLAELGR